MVQITTKILLYKFTCNDWWGHHHGIDHIMLVHQERRKTQNLVYERAAQDVCNIQTHGTKIMQKLGAIVQSRPFLILPHITHQ